MDAWMELTDSEVDAAWRRVELGLRFRPSVQAEDWPSILEPRPFKTYSLCHFWDMADRAGLVADLQSNAARMFQSCTTPSGRMYALDWQHSCYWLRPHLLPSGAPWLIPAFPDGDYYAFLSENLDLGWFAHPWELSICVFGSPLLRALDASKPALFKRTLRVAV
jgi:hypothetical protein